MKLYFAFKRRPYLFLYLIIILLAIAPAFALGNDNRNLLLIGLMFLSPVVLIFTLKGIYRSDIWLLFFMLSLIVIQPLYNPQSLRWSTVLYSCMFCLTFMAYSHLLYLRPFSIRRYCNLLRILLLGYFIVLLIQQFCVLTGLPIFNVSNYDPHTPWKLNALASEPSQSARIIGLLMYCYIAMQEPVMGRKYNFRKDFGKDKWVWIAFLWSMLTMGSGTAFLFIFIVLLKFVRIRNLIPIFLITVVATFLVGWFGITAYERTWKFFLATLTLDPQMLIQADQSAAQRVVPFFVLASKINLTTLAGWFGHGVDYVSTFMYTYIPGTPKGVSGGGLLQVWAEYGFISCIIFTLFSFIYTFNKKDYLSIVFWFFLVSIYGINNQIIWLCIILLYTNKFQFDEYDRIKGKIAILFGSHKKNMDLMKKNDIVKNAV